MAPSSRYFTAGGVLVVVDSTNMASTAALIERLDVCARTASVTWSEVQAQLVVHRDEIMQDLARIVIRRVIEHDIVPFALATIRPKNWRWFHCFRARLEAPALRFPVLDRRPIARPATAPSRLDQRRQKRKSWLQK